MSSPDGRTPVVPDHRVAIGLGFAAAVFAGYMFYDAHEGRGRERPWWLRFVPGG
jgi:hypothetical protein